MQLRPRFQQTILVPKSGQHHEHQSDQGGSSDSRRTTSPLHSTSVVNGARVRDAEPPQPARSSHPASAIGPPRGLAGAARCCADTMERMRRLISVKRQIRKRHRGHQKCRLTTPPDRPRHPFSCIAHAPLRRGLISRRGQKARHEHDADDTKAEEFDWNDVEHEAHRVTLGDHIRTFGEDS